MQGKQSQTVSAIHQDKPQDHKPNQRGQTPPISWPVCSSTSLGESILALKPNVCLNVLLSILASPAATIRIAKSLSFPSEGQGLGDSSRVYADRLSCLFNCRTRRFELRHIIFSIPLCKVGSHTLQRHAAFPLSSRLLKKIIA